MYSDMLPSFERKLLKDDFFITVQVPSQSSSNAKDLTIEFSKRYFYESHLPLVVKRLVTDYLEDFYNYIREDLLENQKERRKFLTDQKKYISSIFENINQFEFIGLSLLNELKAQIIEIEKAVHSPTLYNDKYLKQDKLTLHNWNETDLVTFFHFLRTQKVIDYIPDVELGRFLERNFCVENESEEASSLDNLNKRLNDYKNVNKLNDRSVKRLSELFKKFFKL